MSLDLRDPALDHRRIVAALGLAPHPEGGHDREVWRDGSRGAVCFLLGPGEHSHGDRVDWRPVPLPASR